jgi:SAM-dependent methyltransferase
MADPRYLAEIHPDGLIQENRRLTAEAIARIEAMANDEPRATACPVCDAAELEIFARSGLWTVERCRACGFRFTNPPPTADQLSAFYRSPAKAAENEIFEATRGARLEIFRQRAEFVCRHAAGGSLLEIGGATGLFVEALKERTAQFQLTVLELSPDACERLARRFPDLRIVNGDVLQHVGPYDHIALWETLPYLGNVAAAMRHIAGLLRPGGFLFLNTLNTDGFEHILADAAHPQIQPVPTVSYFNIENLRLLLERSGYEIVEVATPNAHFDVRFARQQKDDPAIRARLGEALHGWLPNEMFAADFADLLRRHCLGGNVTVAARLTEKARV